MNTCETCGKKTTTPPPDDWEVVIVVAGEGDSAVFCPEHKADKLGWLERHGIGIQARLPLYPYTGGAP